MLYKLGYFFNIPNYAGLILTFENNHFVFRSGSMSPLNGNLHYYNMSYYSFDYPVLYNADDGEARSALLLDLIPVRERMGLTGKGYEIEIPPRDGSVPRLFLDGTCLIGNAESNDRTTIFQNTVLFYHSIQKYSLLANKPSKPEEYLNACIKTVKEIRFYIQTLNLYNELADLHIEVEDHYRSKIGDSDNYSAYRITVCPSEIIRNDSYLQSLVGIGTKCIVNERVYGGPVSKVATGVFSKEQLEIEKNRIISQYSEEEHIGHLLFEKYEEDKRRRYFAISWSRKLPDFRKILYQGFHFDRIEGNDELQKMTYPLDCRGHTPISPEIRNNVLKKLNDYIGQFTIA